MNIALHRCHDDCCLFFRIIFDQHWLQIRNGLLHCLRTGNQLRQVIFLFLKKDTHLLDSGDQMLLNDIVRHNSCIQTFLHKVNNTSLTALHHGIKYLLSWCHDNRCRCCIFSSLCFLKRIHAINVTDIRSRTVHQKIRSKSCMHEKIL